MEDPTISAEAFSVTEMAKADTEDVSVTPKQAQAQKARQARDETAKDTEFMKFMQKQTVESERTARAQMKIDATKDAKVQKVVEEVEKKAVKAKIIKYLERFPDLAKEIPRITERSSLPEYLEILDQIRDKMNSRRSLQNLFKYASSSIAILEQTWGDGSQFTMLPPPLRLNVRGMTEQFQKGLFNDDLVPLLMEIDIEYPWLGRQALPMRVLSTFSTMMVKMHMLNTNPNAQKMASLAKAAPLPTEDLTSL